MDKANVLSTVLEIALAGAGIVAIVSVANAAMQRFSAGN